MVLLHIYARWILLVFGHFLPGWLLWSPNSLSYCQPCISLSTSSPRSILRRCFSEDLSTGMPFSIRSTLMVCFCPQVATQALFMIELSSSLSSLLCPVYSMLLHPSPPCILYLSGHTNLFPNWCIVSLLPYLCTLFLLYLVCPYFLDLPGKLVFFFFSF